MKRYRLRKEEEIADQAREVIDKRSETNGLEFMKYDIQLKVLLWVLGDRNYLE